MTGCTVDIATEPIGYYDIKPNPTGAAAFEEVYAELGIETVPAPGYWAASDVGNASYKCPALQPTLKLVPLGTALHTKAVEEACKSDLGHEDIKVGARILARWIAKVYSDPERAAGVKADFAADL